jgi:hypothetical protein
MFSQVCGVRLDAALSQQVRVANPFPWWPWSHGGRCDCEEADRRQTETSEEAAYWKSPRWYGDACLVIHLNEILTKLRLVWHFAVATVQYRLMVCLLARTTSSNGFRSGDTVILIPKLRPMLRTITGIITGDPERA